MTDQPPKPLLPGAAANRDRQNPWVSSSEGNALYLAYSSNRAEALRATWDSIRFSRIPMAPIILPSLPACFMGFQQSAKQGLPMTLCLLISFGVWIGFIALVLATVFILVWGRYPHSNRCFGKLYLRSDGIHSHTQNGINYLPWNMVKKIMLTTHHLYFQIDSGISNSWIALSSFASFEQANRFIAAAMALHESNGNFAVLSPEVCAEFAPPDATEKADMKPLAGQ